MRSFKKHIHQHYLCDQSRKDKVGKACGRYEREDMRTAFGKKNPENMR